MNIKLLTEHYMESLSLKGSCTGSSKSNHVKMTHCWKSHVMANMSLNLQKNYWAMVKSQVPMWEDDMGLKRQKVQTQRSLEKQSTKGQHQSSQKTLKKKRSWLK